jgi:methionine-S-sulfoxide reductase
VRTRVGYAGGTTPDPTYHRLGDHSECIEVDYDADVITYEDLLAVFWASHDARARAYSRQYRSAILVRDEEQRAAAGRSKAAIESRLGPVSTAIETLDRFYLAEDYHQKFEWIRFAHRWERETAGQAPDWRSPEFADHLFPQGLETQPAGISAGIGAADATVGSAGHQTPEERVLADLREALALQASQPRVV